MTEEILWRHPLLKEIEKLKADHLAALAEKEREFMSLLPSPIKYCKTHRTLGVKIKDALPCCIITALTAALAEKDKEIARAWSKFDEAMTGLTQVQLEAVEQIAALQARIKELESLERLYKESLEKYQLWNFDDEARIKELTEALEDIANGIDECQGCEHKREIAKAALTAQKEGV
jgi:chromosome segregation ATPase